MSVQPYLFFNGRAEEAIEFYKKAIGAKVEMLMRFGENPGKGKAPPAAVRRPTTTRSCTRAFASATASS